MSRPLAILLLVAGLVLGLVPSAGAALPPESEWRHDVRQAMSGSRTYVASLGRLVPIVRRGDGARVRREAHKARGVVVPLPHELADVELPAAAHLRRPRVAEVGVVRPDAQLRRLATALEMLDEDSSVSTMCVSRRFHDDTRPWNIDR